MRHIDLIIVHCSATWHKYTAEQCRYDHMHNRHWSDIGYHYYIERDGTVKQGRPLEKVGAHCKGYNAHSIGVCYEGGLKTLTSCPHPSPPIGEGEQRQDSLSSSHPSPIGGEGTGVRVFPCDTRTPEQKLSLLSLLSELKQRFPDAKIVGHHDLNHNKSCPCFDARAEYSKL